MTHDNPHHPACRLIGLCGAAGAGKDTARQILEQHHGFTGLALADPIRDMLRALLRGIVIDPDHWMTDRTSKEQPIPGLGVSYRHLAQTLGTEWGRHCMGDNFWADLARSRILLSQAGAATAPIVISDVRFPDEARMIKSLGGSIWMIDRDGIAPVRAHASEEGLRAIRRLDLIDRRILNNGSIAQLRQHIKRELNASGATP